jgi:hypothetical protein
MSVEDIIRDMKINTLIGVLAEKGQSQVIIQGFFNKLPLKHQQTTSDK